MAKSKKIIVDRFPHTINMRNHRKVKALRARFGSILGYAFWCMMLETLIESETLEWNFTPVEIEVLSSELDVSIGVTQQMVEYCIELEMLKEDDEKEFVHCPSLNEKLKYEKRKPVQAIDPELKAKFIVPTINDVASYFKEKYQSSDKAAADFADTFWNHYNSKGWKVGNAAMKNWKSAVSGQWKETALKIIARFPSEFAIASTKRKYVNFE